MELQTLVPNKNDYGTKTAEPQENGGQSHKQHNGISSLLPKELEKQDNGLPDAGHYEQDKISNIVSLMHFLRGFVAPGVLTTPYIMKLVGIWSGTIGSLAMGWLATFNIITLIKCSQNMCKRLNVPSLDYVDLFGYSLSIGPKFSRNFASESKTMIAVTLTIANVGYCVVYVAMAAAYMQQLMQVYIDGHLFLRPYVLVFCVALLPIVLTTTLSVLAPFSTLGNILNLVNLVIVLQYICRDLPSIESRPWFTGKSDDRGLILIAISNLMFTYEGLGAVLPIENRMIEKESYGGWNGLASLGMSIAVSLYTGFGFFGFLKFGDKTQPSLLLNLPTDEALYKAAKVLNIIILYTSIGFQIFVPSKVIWQGIVRRITSGTLIKYGEYLLRFILLMFITLFTMAVPNMDLVQPLVGAMCGSSLAFVFPPLMMAFIQWSPDDEEEKSMWKCVKHKVKVIFYMALFLLGVCITIFGTVEATIRIVNRYS